MLTFFPNKLIATAVLCFSLVPLLGQEPWSLEQCIEYALDNNINIKQQKLNVELKRNQLQRARFNAFPNLNASANHNYSFGRAIDYGTNTVSQDMEATSFSVNSSVTLFSGFQTMNTIKQEDLNLLASISDVEKLNNSISLNIAGAYLQILFSREILDAAQKQRELSELQLEKTQQFVNAGSLPQGNLFDIEAQLASDELQVVNAQNQLDLAYLTLTQLLDLKSTEGFSILQPNLSNFEETLPVDSPMDIFSHAQNVMPQIKSALLKVSSAEKGMLVAKGARSPRLSLGSSYSSGSRRYLGTPPFGFSNDPFMDQMRDNASINIGISMSVPIFNGLQVKTSISNSYLALSKSACAFVKRVLAVV